MSVALKPLITKAGLAAIWNATSTGVQAEIAYIGLGSQGYTPTVDQKTLRALVVKYPISGGEKLSSSLIHITALADDDKAFWVRELGIYLADGTLFAVWSAPDTPLTYKAAGTELLMAYDLSLEALPADSVTIVSTAAGLNLTLAAPLAAQAAAMLAIEVRHLTQGDELALQTEKLRIVGAYLADVTSRLSGLETRQATNREEILAAVASNAAAVIALQNQFVQHVHGA